MPDEYKGQLTDRPSHEMDFRKDDDACEFIDRMTTAGMHQLEQWYARSVRNLSWISGLQFPMDVQAPNWTYLNNFQQHDADARIPLVWANYLRRYMVNQIVRIVESDIVWQAEARPPADEADVKSARALHRLFATWWDEMDVSSNDSLYRALWYLFATSVMYAHPTWTHQGDRAEVIPKNEVSAALDEFMAEHQDEFPPDADQQHILNRFLKSAFPNDDISRIALNDDGSLTIPKGHLDLRWYDGFNVIEDFSAQTWKDCGWVILRDQMSVEAVRDKWGAKADHVAGTIQSPVFSGFWRPRREERLDGTDGQSPVGTGQPITVVRTLWVAAGPRYPNGWFARECENKIIDSGENPFPHHEIPVVRFTESPDPNDLRPTGVIDDLVILQNSLNRIDQQIISHINKTVDPDIIAPVASVNKEEFLKFHPMIHFYTPHPSGAKPEPWPVEPIAAHVVQMRAILLESIKDLAGLTDPSQGVPSSRAASGRAILALNERYDRQHMLVIRAIERSLTQVAVQLATIWGDFEPDGIAKVVAGRAGESDVVTLRGDDFLAQTQNNGRVALAKFDVKVRIGESHSRSASLDELDWLISRGILHPLVHQNEVLRAMRSGDLTDIDPGHLDREVAAFENERFRAIAKSAAEGEIPDNVWPILEQQLVPIRPGDVHSIHRQGHYAIVKRADEWDSLPLQLKQIIAMHLAEHDKAEAAMQQQEQPQPGKAPARSGGNTNGRR